MAFTLIAEKPEHADAIERVLDRAFGPGRFAKTSERVRERGAVAEPSLSRVALDEAGEVVGVCRIWRVQAGAPLHFIGPLAVDPRAQNAGLGLQLAGAVVNACRNVGGGGAIVVGPMALFEPLGFRPTPPDLVSLPGPVNPARLLWLEFRDGGLDAVRGAVSAPMWVSS